MFSNENGKKSQICRTIKRLGYSCQSSNDASVPHIPRSTRYYGIPEGVDQLKYVQRLRVERAKH